MAKAVKLYELKKCGKGEFSGRSFGPDYNIPQDEQFKAPVKVHIAVTAESDILEKHSKMLYDYSQKALANPDDAEKYEAEFIAYAQKNEIACVKQIWENGMSWFAGKSPIYSEMAYDAITNNDMDKLRFALEALQIEHMDLYEYIDWAPAIVSADMPDDIIKLLFTTCHNPKELINKIIDYAVDFGADISKLESFIRNTEFDAKVKDSTQRTVLMRYMESDHETPGFVKLMVKYGADINEKYDDGDSLLHRALDNMNYIDAEELIDARADVNVKDRYGVTPLVYAVLCNDEEILAALLKAGATVNTEEGCNVVEAAYEWKYAMELSNNLESFGLFTNDAESYVDKIRSLPCLLAEKNESERLAIIKSIKRFDEDYDVPEEILKAAEILRNYVAQNNKSFKQPVFVKYTDKYL